MILLKAKGQALTVEQMETIASDFVNVCTVHWTFDARWNGMVKTAQYTQVDTETKERVTYSVLIDDATGCAIMPNEIKAGDVEISAFGEDAGSGQRITTVPVTIRVERSGFVGDGETPIPPSPDLYDQLLNRIAAIQGTVESVNGYQGVVELEAVDVGAVAVDQGKGNAGKILVINENGFVIPGTTAGGAVESVNGQKGAVTLNAGDVGARPATWTPTAADVGAAAANHKHTAEEVGARPATWTPTAADVGAAAANHKHTAEDMEGLAEAISAGSQPVKLWPEGDAVGSWAEGSIVDVPGIADYNALIICTSLAPCVAWRPEGIAPNDSIMGGGFTITATGIMTSVAFNMTYTEAGCKLNACKSVQHKTSDTHNAGSTRTITAVYGVNKRG